LTDEWMSLIVCLLCCFSYLNSQYIKKQKISEADMNYGGFTIDTNEQLMEIGEVVSQSTP